ncbi:uncharacterized protein LOC143174719 isoform X2 [Nomia melanderi]
MRLKVSLAGRPPPSVTWYHDGEAISEDSRHILETMDNESILKIPDAKRMDRGEYTVKATNKLGEDISSFLVTVTDRPAAPGKAMVTMTLGRSVTLSWNEPEDDGGCKIGTYVVEYYRVGWDVWLKATTSRQTKATMSELIEGSEYKFRVKAENPYGMSEPGEESDVIFIPDLKRGIVTPSLGGKSQSHREIRSREKREVSFAVPTQRTRSLTREEGRARDEDDEGRFGPSSRSVSAQRLSRPSRADSRVTFALDTMDKTVTPVPPTRLRDHSTSKHDSRADLHVEHSNISADVTETFSDEKDTVTVSMIPATVPVLPPLTDESSKRSMFRESRSRSVSVSRERSMSPLSMPKIQEEEGSPDTIRPVRPQINISLRKQQAIVDEPEPPFIRTPSVEEKPNSPVTPREDDETVLHGSSEFMLVLYTEDQDKKLVDIDGRPKSLETRQSATEEAEEMEDLIPPPMSLSLPELFSVEHQVVETLREAVSSTELLHERAMERFYRAVAAEEASEIAKRKQQLERRTGELATTVEEKTETDVDNQDTLRTSILRRLSNPSVTAQNLITWQAKRNRRRSSEGQAETIKSPLKELITPSLLSAVEARSDPNLPSDSETPTGVWGLDKEADAATQLRRWHDSNVPLVGEEQEERSMLIETDELTSRNRAMSPTAQAIGRADSQQEELEEEESIESLEESESEDISSADSEDLKLLKARILARQVLEEEDTYHPRGRPVPHVEPDLLPPLKIPTVDITPPTPKSVPASPTGVIPKSILKKRKEEPIPVNSFGRPIPPEKPVRKILPVQSVEPMISTEGDTTDREEIRTPEPPKTPILSESDTDSVLSAGEAAKTRRIQAKMRTTTSEEEVDEEDHEARMAVVNHYTEIVREHSSRYNYRSSEERKFDSRASSRRSSFSEDQEVKTQLNRERPETSTPGQVIKRQDSKEGAEKVEQKPRGIMKKGTKIDKPEVQEDQKPKRTVGSRGTTPAREIKAIKDSQPRRPRSRNESPAPRSRNVSKDRGETSSRSSSKTRVRAPSQERKSISRTGSEEQRYNREKSVDIESRQSRRPSHSRSSSRDRIRPETPVKIKVERLQKALESKKYRSSKRGSRAEYSEQGRQNDEQLALEATKNVRFTVDYVTDLTLLMAAVYVYLFKKETMAIPFIALLLYRRIQHEIKGRVSGRWWWSKEKK